MSVKANDARAFAFGFAFGFGACFTLSLITPSVVAALLVLFFLLSLRARIRSIFSSAVRESSRMIRSSFEGLPRFFGGGW
jgi:hypothetical protein